MKKTKLFVNVDHVATLRQSRGTVYPDPIAAAVLCDLAGADGITVHLREDRRHIQDRDVFRLRESVNIPFNFEMGASAEMVSIAEKVKPDWVTIVPERREELTTEGGLDVASQCKRLSEVIQKLKEQNTKVSLFIDPKQKQIEAASEVQADCIELHTGDFANANIDHEQVELRRIRKAADVVKSLEQPMMLAAGHGLTRRNVVPLLKTVPEIESLHIGHALVSDAVLVGMDKAVTQFIKAIAEKS